MFLTDAVIQQSLADALKVVNVAALPAYAANIVTEQHVTAYNQIVSALLGRGYTLAQITAWDDGPNYERRIALFLILSDVGGLGGFDDKFIKTYDCRKDLQTLLLAIGGVFVAPGVAAGPGTVGFGQEDTSRDLIVPDPNDPRRGQVTRW